MQITPVDVEYPRISFARPTRLTLYPKPSPARPFSPPRPTAPAAALSPPAPWPCTPAPTSLPPAAPRAACSCGTSETKRRRRAWWRPPASRRTAPSSTRTWACRTGGRRTASPSRGLAAGEAMYCAAGTPGLYFLSSPGPSSPQREHERVLAKWLILEPPNPCYLQVFGLVHYPPLVTGWAILAKAALWRLTLTSRT